MRGEEALQSCVAPMRERDEKMASDAKMTTQSCGAKALQEKKKVLEEALATSGALDESWICGAAQPQG